MDSQISLNFGGAVVCECGTIYYGLVPEVCIFCEAEKYNKIVINFKKDSGYRASTQNCGVCFYSTIVENGSLSCLVLGNENVEIPVSTINVCNYWSDGDENEMDSLDE